MRFTISRGLFLLPCIDNMKTEHLKILKTAVEKQNFPPNPKGEDSAWQPQGRPWPTAAEGGCGVDAASRALKDVQPTPRLSAPRLRFVRDGAHFLSWKELFTFLFLICLLTRDVRRGRALALGKARLLLFGPLWLPLQGPQAARPGQGDRGRVALPRLGLSNLATNNRFLKRQL